MIHQLLFTLFSNFCKKNRDSISTFIKGAFS